MKESYADFKQDPKGTTIAAASVAKSAAAATATAAAGAAAQAGGRAFESAKGAAGGAFESAKDYAENSQTVAAVASVGGKLGEVSGRAIGAVDKNAGGDAGTPRTGEKRKPGAAAGGSADAKKPRRVPRPSRRARLAAKGIYE